MYSGEKCTLLSYFNLELLLIFISTANVILLQTKEGLQTGSVDLSLSKMKMFNTSAMLLQ